jgi:Na+-transporting NADH:ubiquinone oxidoreductase subunit A
MENMIATKFSKLITLSTLFTSFSFMAFAQQGQAPITANSLVVLLFTCVMVLVVFLAAILGDKIIKLVAAKLNPDLDGANVGLVASLKEMILGSSKLSNDSKKKVITLSKGFDIKLKGKAKKVIANYSSATYAIKPTDFRGLKPIPKMIVKEGSKVKAGDKLFYDKGFEGVFFTAPVSGEVLEIKRVAKRAISEIIIKSDGKFESVKFKTGNPSTLSKKEIIANLTESGAWTLFLERPFGVVASLHHTPKAIYISASDTAPLAVNYGFVLNQLDKADFQAGIDALNKLSNHVHLNLDTAAAKSSFSEGLQNVQVNYFQGQHPAGNVGVQIHHIDGISKGDVVWTIKAEDVVTIGKLFTQGIYEPTKYVAVAGFVLKNTKYIKAMQGFNIADLLANNLTDEHVRVISGNVLSGTKIEKDGFLGFYDNNISVIEEGDQQEMFGWLVPQYARPSLSPTFPWKNMELASFEANSNMHGEKRAFVVTGQYEEVLPMDLYPQHLIKAIIKNDFEEIEGLGIYELLEEDLALAEFSCTSKQPLQHILREGLDYIRSQS